MAALVVLLVVSPLAGVVAADTGSTAPMAAQQQANNTTQTPQQGSNTSETAQQNNWSAPGPFGISYLSSNGKHPAAAPASVRYLDGSDGPGGAVALRHRPTNPLENEPKFLEPGTELNGDELEIYSTIFGEATGEYEFVIVFWQQEQKTVNETTVTYAADQEVQRIGVTLEDGYASADVSLKSHYDETWQATAWLEQGGDPAPGAKWRFSHASLPASQQVQINTRADAWWYALRTAILPGIAGIILGLMGAQLTLRKTGDGPGYGLVLWGIVGSLALLTALSGLYYEVAAVVAHFEILMGLSLGVIAYGGGLRMSPPTEKIRFPRKELRDARSLRNRPEETAEDGDAMSDGGTTSDASDIVEIPADGYKDELYEDEETLTTVRGEDGSRLVTKTGLGPFFARLFADGATLNLQGLQTRVRVRNGDAAEKVFLDPESDGLSHTAAQLKRRMPVWHRLPEPEEDEEHDLVTKGLYGALTIGALALPYIGWQVGAATINAPMIGAAVGTVLLGIESYGAHDGYLNYDEAPRHFVSADASLTVLQNELVDAKTIEELEEIAWEERSRTALEARDVEARRDKSIIQRMNERALGMDLDILDGDAGDAEESAEERLGGPSREDVDTEAEADD